MSNPFKVKEKEVEFWNNYFKAQLAKYPSECSPCTCRKMTDEEIEKYCKK